MRELLPSSVAGAINPVSRKGKEREGMGVLPPHRGKQLYLGERNISFQRGALGVIVSWDIIFDSLGFAGSKLSLSSKIPTNCTSLQGC
jgi:hypothetical protein